MECVVPWVALVELLPRITPQAETAPRPLRSRPCCACTSCSSGSEPPRFPWRPIGLSQAGIGACSARCR